VEIRDVHPDTPFGWTNLKNGSFTWKVIRENGKKIENQVDGESGIEKPDPEKESA
jgi:hypothetical protein